MPNAIYSYRMQCMWYRPCTILRNLCGSGLSFLAVAGGLAVRAARTNVVSTAVSRLFTYVHVAHSVLS